MTFYETGLSNSFDISKELRSLLDPLYPTVNNYTNKNKSN